MPPHFAVHLPRAASLVAVLAIPLGRAAAQAPPAADSTKRPVHSTPREARVPRAPYAIGRVDGARLSEVPGVTALGGLAGKISAVHLLAPPGHSASAPA